MSFPHPLPSASSRLPRPFPLHSSRAACPSPTYRTVCCAVVTSQGNSTWVHPVSVPRLSSPGIFHPTAIPSSRSCLVLLVSSHLASHLVTTQWQPALFVAAASPSWGHRGVLSDGVWHVRVPCVCFFVCVLLPRLSRAEKDQPLPGPGTVMSPHRKCPGSSDNPCRLPAAHFLVISTGPVCPRLHVQKRTCVRPSSLQAEVIVADHVDPRPLKINTPPPRTWLLQVPVVPQILATPALMFQCCNTYIMLCTWHRCDAAAWAPSRGLDAAAALAARTVFAPKAWRRTWNSA